MAKATETKLTVPGEEDKELKAVVKKSDELLAKTEAAEQPKTPADDAVKALEERFDALQDLVKQALAAVLKPKDNENGTAEDQKANAPVRGETMSTDAGTAWEEMVPVRTPRRTKGQEKSIVITVNDRNVQVPLDGKVYHLRRPHAEIFEESMMAEIAAEEFAESVPNNAAPETYQQAIVEMAALKEQLRQLGINVS